MPSECKAAEAEKAAEVQKALEAQTAAEAQLAAAGGRAHGRVWTDFENGYLNCAYAGLEAAASSQIQEALVTVLDLSQLEFLIQMNLERLCSDLTKSVLINSHSAGAPTLRCLKSQSCAVAPRGYCGRRAWGSGPPGAEFMPATNPNRRPTTPTH